MSTILNQNESVAETHYSVRCFKCELAFDAMAAPWCACDHALRTIVCPRCASCFCAAPLPYKRKFWSGAPRSLKEHANRFRLSHRVVPPAGPLPVTQDAAAHSPLHLLIVDDEEPIRSLVACYAEQLGYAVTTAGNGDEALSILADLHVDIVLTDALMPKMDGRELCRLAKQAHPTLQTILMTSLYKGSRFKTEAHRQFGVDEYLTKPLLFSDLEAALRRVAFLPLSPLTGKTRSSRLRTHSGFQTP